MGNLFLSKFSAQTTIITSVVILIFLSILSPLSLSFQAEAVKYPFKLTITLEKTYYKLGESVNVTWILTNISEENVTLYHSCDLILDFLIHDVDFAHIFRYRVYVGVASVEYPFKPLAPSNNITLIDSWNQIYDSILETRYPAQFKQVPPGIYFVSGFFQSSTYNMTLETSPIRITIA